MKIENTQWNDVTSMAPNLYIKKYSNLLQPVRVMIFLYPTTISLIKLIFYITNKKTVDLKLQDRIRRSNSFARYLVSIMKRYLYGIT